MKVDRFRPAFVSDIPDDLDEGVLYLALDYDAMVHLCACGCGSEISTPISPTDWKIAWDGVGIIRWRATGDAASSWRPSGGAESPPQLAAMSSRSAWERSPQPMTVMTCRNRPK